MDMNMEREIRLRYGAIQRGLPEGTAITVLHIGEEQTAVASGTGAEPDAVRLLSIGSETTAAEFFQHTPPTPGELENAIMQVEDEVTRARAITTADSALFSADPAIREIALVAGLVDQSKLVFALDAVERTFDQLAAVALGRPAGSAGIPASADFAARLLILREFMHHLQFAAVTVTA
jgi:exopolyphosphatase/pppGpp-phosphohydrolase